ncbi:MAG TPA: c-type cytochrome [Candidatus Acidoferrum sp.]|nr:c-type cytochrome [Candidatus Acidoferrum sp.]
MRSAGKTSLSPMSPERSLRLAVGALALLLCAATDNSWIQKVPQADRERVNPYAGNRDAIAGGAKVFADHCAKCHGSDALGRGKKPSLRTDVVQNATDGELFWILKNGYLSHGMPTWSSLPEPVRWEVIAYVKSLGINSPSASAKDPTPATSPGEHP